LVRKIARLAVLILLGIVGAGLVLGAVGVAQLGSSSSREVVMRFLDDRHITGPKTEWWRAARTLERADPSRDALRALRSDDTRLLALAGFGPSFPGLDDRQFQSYASRYGVRFLAAGCVVSCGEEMRYREAGVRYAETYNRLIVASLKR
jgi:hypothetical protein